MTANCRDQFAAFLRRAGLARMAILGRNATFVFTVLLLWTVCAKSADQCEQLTELQCIESGTCTLEQTGGRDSDYRCRAAKNFCEEGFNQRTGREEECESRSGCVYQPQECYCSPDVLCLCGGGPPATCTLKVKKTE